MHEHVLWGSSVPILTKPFTLISTSSLPACQPECIHTRSSWNILCSFIPLCLCLCHSHCQNWHFLLLLYGKFLLILQSLVQMLLLLQKLPGYSKAEPFPPCIMLIALFIYASVIALWYSIFALTIYINTFMSTCKLCCLKKLSPFKIINSVWKSNTLLLQTHSWSGSKYSEWYYCLKNLHVFSKFNSQVITTYLYQKH